MKFFSFYVVCFIFLCCSTNCLAQTSTTGIGPIENYYFNGVQPDSIVTICRTNKGFDYKMSDRLVVPLAVHSINADDYHAVYVELDMIDDFHLDYISVDRCECDDYESIASSIAFEIIDNMYVVRIPHEAFGKILYVHMSATKDITYPYKVSPVIHFEGGPLVNIFGQEIDL